MSVKVTGVITPINETDTYPVIDPQYGIDGSRTVETVSDMYNIPLERRRGGMLVGVRDSVLNLATYYILKPGVTWSLGDSTNWTPLITPGTVSAIPVKYNISNESVTIPLNYQYLVYGDFTIGASGSVVNLGHLYIMNGDLVLQSDGTYSSSGRTLTYLNIPVKPVNSYPATQSKVSFTFSLSPGATYSITHNLNSQDLVYSVRDGYNFIYPNIELDPTDSYNKIILTTTGTVSNGSINIMS